MRDSMNNVSARDLRTEEEKILDREYYLARMDAAKEDAEKARLDMVRANNCHGEAVKEYSRYRKLYDESLS